jgi:glycine/D-amino acid oxidase-like deaminating enzyme
MKLIVIGAGIAGSSVARIAQSKNWEVSVIDPSPDQSASRCALATIRPTWFDKSERVDLERSWEWYKEWNSAGSQEAFVTNWRNPEPKKQKDWWLVDPILPLVSPDNRNRVIKVNPTSVELNNGEILEADAIINCTGAYGEDLAQDVTPYAGVTWISHNAELDFEPYRVHHTRPFHAISVAKINGVTRLGSTISKEMDVAMFDAVKMLEHACDLGMVKSGDWEMRAGWRAKGKGGLPIYPEMGKRNTSFSGLARSGYGLSPAIAEKWIESL